MRVERSGDSCAASRGCVPAPGGALSYEWFVNGTSMQLGPAPAFCATMSVVGVTEVRVAAVDDLPLGGSVVHAWQVGVVTCAPAWGAYGDGRPGTLGMPSVTPMTDAANGRLHRPANGSTHEHPLVEPADSLRRAQPAAASVTDSGS